jgi:hypothetical protein
MLFTYSTPTSFADLGRNDIDHPYSIALCYVSGMPRSPFEILQGSLLGRFQRVRGLSLTLQGSILARWLQLQPWMLSCWYLELCMCCWIWMGDVTVM